jgi:hypothetical protein
MPHPECPHCHTLLPAPVEIIPVGLAVLCANCNCLTRATNGHCLACGSAAIVNIGKLLWEKEEVAPTC